MKKNLFAFLVLLLFCLASHAQTKTLDTISITKKMLSADMDFNGKTLSPMKLDELCKPFTDANDEIFLAKRNSTPALLLTLVGAALIGYTGIKWAFGDTPQWYFAGGGAVLIGATIPLYIGARNHNINAARIYNYEIKHQQKSKP